MTQKLTDNMTKAQMIKVIMGSSNDDIWPTVMKHMIKKTMEYKKRGDEHHYSFVDGSCVVIESNGRVRLCDRSKEH